METRWALVLLGFCVSGVTLITQHLYSFEAYHLADYPDKAFIKANSVASCAKNCSRVSNCELFGYNKEKKVCQISMPRCLLSIPKPGQSSVVLKCFRKRNDPFATPSEEAATTQNDDPSTTPLEVRQGLITRNITFLNGTSIVRNLAEDNIFNHEDLVGVTFQFTSDHQEQTFVIEFESTDLRHVSVTVDFSYCMKGMIKENGNCHAFIRRPGMNYTGARGVCEAVGGKVSSVNKILSMDPQRMTSSVDDTPTYLWVKDSKVKKGCEKLFLDGTGNSSILYNEPCNDPMKHVSCQIQYSDEDEDKLKVKDRCYYGYHLNGTWDDGNSLCQDLGFQMAIPIYDSSATDGLKNQEIFRDHETVNSEPMSSAWIGLIRDGSSWFTSDDSQLFSFNNFEDFIHPDSLSMQSGCAYTVPGTDKFFLDSCSVERPVLCFFECAHPFKVTAELEQSIEIPFYAQILDIAFPQIPYSSSTNRQYVKFKISRNSRGRYGDFTLESIGIA